MSVDREKVRPDDEPTLADPYTRIAWWTQRCERIEAELEQAERERDEARAEVKRHEEAAYEESKRYDAQLVVVPALVEALRDIQWSWNGYCPECERTPMKSHDDSCRIGNALSKWEQAQKPKANRVVGTSWNREWQERGKDHP